MRKLITTLFLLFAALPCLTALAAPEVQYTMDGENHVVGTVTVDGYTFPIDALLDDTLPTAGSVTYTIREDDPSVIAQALRDCFPATADALVEKLSTGYGGEVRASLRGRSLSTMVMQIPPCSQTVPDDQLLKLQGQCEAFLAQIGLSCHPLPFRCTYLIDGVRRSDMLAIPTENKDKATHIGIYFLPAVDGAVTVPHFQTHRIGGTVKDTGNSPIGETPAFFIFNLDGELVEFSLHHLEMTTSGQLATGFLSWEDALCETMEEMMKSDHLMEHFPQGITFTSIRPAWDMDEAGHGKPGWLISFYGTRPSDTSPLGWDNFGNAYFVYGE